MWRSLFSAVGIMLLIVGVQFFLVDEAILADSVLERRDSIGQNWLGNDADVASDLLPTTRRNFSPPEWAPYSLLSSGAVVLLYTLGMRSRGG
ncbi:MAG: hypothetical protein O2931_10385 [Planctomycetota bacterium]|nr:hypothetical protein [Planctomycetota bacterium]MDA1179190.1 hypothetical protein [Planctomycetota bacterium]